MNMAQRCSVTGMFDYNAPVILLVAHPDDESIGAGLLLQRLRRACIVFCADGTSWWPLYWLTYCFPPVYARLRRQEAVVAIGMAGRHHEAQFLGHPDGSLATELVSAYQALAGLFRSWQPEHVITHAFEGGHEDHDACSFLAAALCKEFNCQAWEMPLYYRNATTGKVIRQAFAPDDPDGEILTPISESELAIKKAMLAAHASQQDIVSRFDPGCERFRRQPVHDYSVWPKYAIPRKRFGFSPYRSLKAFQSFQHPS